jgi:proteasome accessory factor A
MSALDIQRLYLDRALEFADSYGFTDEEMQALHMWEHCISTIERDPLLLDREVDWVIKLKLISQFMEKKNVGLDDPSVNVLDLQYHDIDPARGVFNKMQSKGLVEQMLTSDSIDQAKDVAPTTTRAHLRGKFVRAAKAKNKDFTVDWIHLKMNDTTQRTVLCKDPFANVDERVERLIESL